MKCIVHQVQSMFAWKPISMLVCFHLRTLTLKSTKCFFQVFKSKLTILEKRGVYIYIYTYLYVFIVLETSDSNIHHVIHFPIQPKGSGVLAAALANIS